ncbi:MAG: hypothetical protein JW837_02890 [Sedimentisphaerales bacterium]|nr:hypothetical protein [Sedimentisphaerales bacterium]
MKTGNITLIFLLISAICISGCGKRSSKTGSENEMSINITLTGKIKSMDPVSIRAYETSLVVYHIFEPLYQYHYLKRPYVAVPLVAESMPQISEDKLTYTIKIKKGVFYQDDKCFPGGKGRELKAEDFVFSLKRIADIKNLSENWYNYNERIAGLDEFREYTKTCKSAEEVDYSRHVEGLYAADDYTLVIKLVKPWPDIINSSLTDIAVTPVSKEAVDYYGKDIISHPVGTGPFMLKQWRRGSYVELIRNPNFRGETYPTEGGPGDAEAGLLDDAGKPIPFADRLTFRVVEEQQPSWFLFMKGQTDSRSIPKDNWAEAISESGDLTEKMKKLNIKLHTFLQPSVFWVGFNMDNPVLGKNKPLRRAISYAIDREKFIELFFNGQHEVAHGFISPELNSYDPNISRYGFSEYNPDKARQLLKEAEKIHEGPIPVLKLGLPGTETFYRQMAELFTQYFEDVGLTVEFDFMDWPTYQQKQNKKQLQMFSAGIVAGSVDVLDIMEMFYSKKMSPGPNKFNYSNRQYDKLYEKVSVMLESNERLALYRKMEVMICEDCPATFLNHRVASVLVHSWYKNYKPHVFGYGLGKYRKIDMEEKAAYKELFKQVQ